MKDDSTRIELMAIPIVVIILGIGLVLLLAADQGLWAWLLIGLAAFLAIVIVAVRLSKRKPHSTGSTPPTTGVTAPSGGAGADGTYRVLVIADESCVDPSFPAKVADHAAGRKVEALVIAPAIGSWLSRWTGDESQYADARTHLDETVAALAAAGIPARGETGADDPLQAADDGLREFPAHEIVFVTKPGTHTDWVEKGVVSSAKERYSIPVTHIELAAG